MDKAAFDKKLQNLIQAQETFLSQKNIPKSQSTSLYDRYEHPVITAAHTPLFWRYDLNYDTNPHLMERMGINAAFNAGAIEFGGKMPCRAGRRLGQKVFLCHCRK